MEAERTSDELATIVATLPTTVDGEPIYLGRTLYGQGGEAVVVRGVLTPVTTASGRRTPDVLVSIGDDGMPHRDWSHLLYASQDRAVADDRARQRRCGLHVW